MKHRSDLYQVYIQFVADVRERHRHRIDLICHQVITYNDDVSVIRSDNAREYKKLETIILNKYGTKCQFSHAHSPQQNGVAERIMLSLMSKVRAALLDGQLPAQLWGEAVLTINTMNNATPARPLDNDNPYRSWHGYQFRIQKFRVFGCVAFAHIQKEDRTGKLGPRAIKCMFVGYLSNQSGYKLLNVTNRNVIHSRDVVFREDRFATLDTDDQTPEETAKECGCSACIQLLTLPHEDTAPREVSDPPTATAKPQSEISNSPGVTFNPVVDIAVPARPQTDWTVDLQNREAAKNHQGATVPARRDSAPVESPVPRPARSVLKRSSADLDIQPTDIKTSGGTQIPGQPIRIDEDQSSFQKRRLREAPGQDNLESGSALETALTQEEVMQHYSFYVSEQIEPTERTFQADRQRAYRNMVLNLQSTDHPMLLTGKAARRARRRHSVLSRNYDDDPDDVPLDDKLYIGSVLLIVSHKHKPDPQSYKEAMASALASEWQAASDSEMDALNATRTYSLVPAPPGRKILQCKWVFNTKYLGNGEIERYKARLVVKGFLQKYGIDYIEIFSPVVRMEVLRLLLTIAAALDWEIHQMDVKTAFLHGELEEDVYVYQPEGYVVKGKENLVWKLHKSLYGLKQAPRVWHFTLAKFLVASGFKQLKKDRCVFVKLSDGDVCYVSAYVDDLLIIGNNMSVVNEFKRQISAQFTMKDLGEVKYILGWHIHRDRANRTIFINQEKYMEKILERYGQTETRGCHIPMQANTILKESDRPADPADVALMQQYPYREVIGSLMYLMIGTRPDLATLIRQTSRHLTNPGLVHWQALKQGLRYLRGTSTHGIMLGGKHCQHMIERGNFLSAYVDADYANSDVNRRSATGYVTQLCGGSPISWRSQLQTMVTLSSTEAEYIALAACVQELLYLKMLLSELGIQQTEPILVHEDNQSCIKIVNNPAAHGRTKHIDVKHFFVQEAQSRKEILLQYIQSADQIADIFTKALPGPAFQKLRHKLQVLSRYEALRHLMSRHNDGWPVQL